MWTVDDPAPHAQRASSRGYTFLEVAFVIVIFGVMGLVVDRTMGSTADAQRLLKAVMRATERGHGVSYEIREQVSRSRRMFFRDDIGHDYMDALDLGEFPVLPEARLPIVDASGRLEQDADGDPRTGSALLFVTEADAIAAVSDSSAGTIRHIDVYRFVCVYPSESSRRVVTTDDRLLARDLVIWKSVEFPNYEQIMGIEDEDERAAVVSELVNRHGYTTAWHPSESVDNSFYRMESGGSISGSPELDVEIDEDSDRTERGRLVYANIQLARTDASSYHRRSVFTVDDPADWKPDGLEVKVVGPSGSRLVWVRVVVEVEATRGQVAVHASSLTASVRDL